MQVDFTPAELVRVTSAAASAIESMREFCRETNHKWHSMNSIHRDAIRDTRSAHAKMLVVLRGAGYSMEGCDIPDAPEDE